MSLAAHKFIDGLLGRGNKYSVWQIKGLEGSSKIHIAGLIRDAEKFDFEELHLEPSPTPGLTGSWAAPRLTDDEVGFWSSELLPLPAPLCWYEWDLNRNRSGMLVTEVDGGWAAARLDIVAGNQILWDGIWVRCFYPNPYQIQVYGNDELRELMKDSRHFMEANVEAIIPLARYFTLMLNSRSTTVVRVTPDAALNKSRTKKGLTKLAEHRVVRIVPDKFKYERDPVTGKLTERRAPRLHWRRSHLRHYENGKVAVIPRCLVGRAENGNVSHEYKFIDKGE